MNLFTPAETTQNYSKTGKAKAERPASHLFLLGILAGILIGLGGVACNTAGHSVTNPSVGRIISGLLFPFGLAMVMMTGAELFTGNCLISISVLNKDTTLTKMLRNWGIVYLGNLTGSLVLAAGCAYFGQMNLSNGGLAVYTIKAAASKCALSFPNAVVLGIFCNVLVCIAVLCSLSAQDLTGRILGAYLPVAYFVLCGFEHCVANMYFIPAGLFAAGVPQYAQLAAEAGIDMAMLTWGNFLFRNLLPVTIGNIIGGVAVGALMWYCNRKKA